MKRSLKTPGQVTTTSTLGRPSCSRWIIVLLALLQIVGGVSCAPLFHSVIRRRSCHEAKPEHPVIILHGLFGSTKNFQSWAKLLYQTLDGKKDIICIDLRNHGRSSVLGERDMDYEIMGQDVLDTADFLKISQFHLLGHSMGGKVAAASALLSSSYTVKSLSILDISPVTYTESEFSSVLSALELLVSIDGCMKTSNSKMEIERLLGESLNPDVKAFLMSNIQRDYDDNGFRWRFNLNSIERSKHKLLEFSLRNPMGIYGGPVFILKAAGSDFVKAKHLNEIKMYFPNFSLSTERGHPPAGHFLHVEKPIETTSKIAAFLSHQEST